MPTMPIDTTMARDFVSGDITAKAFKTYLRGQIEETMAPPVAGPVAVQAGVREPTFREKVKLILERVKQGTIYTDAWEQVFLIDNLENNDPTHNQIERLEKIWRRYTLTQPK
jgi:hypothetical protein